MSLLKIDNLKELDDGNFSKDSDSASESRVPTATGEDVLNSDEEHLDDAPFLSHQLSPDQESFSEKFLRNILTLDYQNLMPRRREKFVEITKTVTVTEIVNGAADKHPSACEVKVTNVSPAGPHPVKVSIKRLHQKWHSSEDLDEEFQPNKRGTTINIQETHKPFEGFPHEDVYHTKVEQEQRARSKSQDPSLYFDRSSDNIIDLEFTHPILVESQSETMNGSAENAETGSRRKFADLRKRRVSTSTTTSTTEMEKVTTTTKTTKRRSTSSHSTSSRSRGKPEVQTLYYRKFVETNNDAAGHDADHPDNASDSGASVLIHSDSEREKQVDSAPVAPPRKRLGREESLHYYREDEEVAAEKLQAPDSDKTRNMEKRRIHLTKSPPPPEPGYTSVSLNDSADHQNLTAGITSVSMNDSCTDTSFESRFSTIPRSSKTKVNHIQVNVIGPSSPSSPPYDRAGSHPIVGRVGEDVTMNIYIGKSSKKTGENRSRSEDSRGVVEPPPKPPRRSKWDGEQAIGEPLATSTPMTTIERKQNRDSMDGSEPPSRKSTRGSRPPDINIIGCEAGHQIHDTAKSPSRTPCTPIVVVNQNPSRRGSQDLLAADPSSRRRKSTVTDIDWYAAFNMKVDPSSPRAAASEERKASRDSRRRASESSAVSQPVDIDLNQIFTCTGENVISKDEKCQCNACRLIRMSEAERALRKRKESRQHRIHSMTFSEKESGYRTLPSRHFTPPVDIALDDVFNPRPSAPSRPSLSIFSSVVDESSGKENAPKSNIDRNQVISTSTITNQHDFGKPVTSTHNLRGGIVQEDSEITTVTTTKTTFGQDGERQEKQPRKTSVTRRISFEELQSDSGAETKKNLKKEDIVLPPSDVSIDDIFTALTVPKKAEDNQEKLKLKPVYIVTRKQRAQDVEAIEFRKHDESNSDSDKEFKEKIALRVDELEKSIRRSSQNSNRSSIRQVEISLDDVFNHSSASSKEKSLENEVDHVAARVAEFEKTQREKIQTPRSEETSIQRGQMIQPTTPTKIDLEDVFDSKMPSKGQGAQTSGVYATSIEFTPYSNISSDDVFEKSSLKTSEKKDEVSKELDHITTRVHEFEKNEEERIQKPHQDTKDREELSIKPTTPTNFSLDDVFNSSSRKEEKNDEVSKELDHIATRVHEFEKNEEERIQKPHQSTENREELTIKPTTPTNFFLDDVFNSSSRKNEKKDEISKELDHITTRVHEFEKNEEERIQKPHQDTEDREELTIKPTTPTNFSLDDVFNSSSRKNEKKDEISKELDHITTRVHEFEKNEEERIQKPHQDTEDREELTIKPTTPTNFSLDDVFSSSSRKEEKKDEISKELDHITTRVHEFEKNEEERIQKPHQDTEDREELTIKPTTPTNFSLDDVFSSSSRKEEKNDEVSKELDHITTRVHEFEKNEEERIQKPAQNPEDREELTIKPTTPTKFSLNAVFNQSSEKKKQKDEISKEVDHITTRVHEFEKNEQERIQKPVGNSEDREKLTIKPTTPTNFSLDDVFNSSSRNEEQKDEVSKELDHIATRVHEFEKNEEEKIKKPVENSGDREKLTIKPTTPTNFSLDDVFNSSPRKEERKDEVSKELDHITARVHEFKKNEEEITQKPQQNPEDHEDLTIKPTTPTNFSLDEVFNSSPAKKNQKDEINKELDHITTRVYEFEKNAQERIQKPQQNQKDHEDQSIKPTIPTNFSLDDVFNNSSEKKMQKDEVSKELDHITTRVHEFEKNEQERTQKPAQNPEDRENLSIEPTTSTNFSLDDVFNQSSGPKEQKDEIIKELDHITTRVREFEKNEEEKIQKPHRDTEDRGELTIKPTTPTNFSLDDIFNSSSRKNEKKDDVEKKLDHIATRVHDFEKNEKERIQKPAENPEDHEKLTIKPTTPTNFLLDDVFNSSSRREEKKDEVSKELDHITTRVHEFEKNEEERIQKPHQNLETREELTIKPTTPTNFSLDDVFNQSSVQKEQKDEASKELDHITTRVHEFEKNEQERIQKPQQHPEDHEDLTIKPTTPTNFSLDAVFNGGATSSHKLEQNQDERSIMPQEHSLKLREELGDNQESEKSQPSSGINFSLDDVFSKPGTANSGSTRQKKTDNLLPPENWQDSFASATSTISLEDSFGISSRNTNNFAQSQREIIPTQTPPNSDSEQEPRAQYPKAVKVDINLADVFTSPPMTEVSTEAVESRKSLHLPVDNWIDEFVAKTTEEATREAPKTPKTPKTPVQLLAEETAKTNFPSPTRVSSEIKIEWIADILKSQESEEHQDQTQVEENFEQQNDKSWVSRAIYRPTSETTSYNLRASQVYSDDSSDEGREGEAKNCPKATTSSDATWIEAMLEDIGHHPEKFDGMKTIDVPRDGYFLEDIFRKAGVKSHNDNDKENGQAEKCDCSACRLTSLSEAELAELKRRWEERKHIEAQPSGSHKDSEALLVRKTSFPEKSDISMDDIFSSETNFSTRFELANRVEGHVKATRAHQPTENSASIITLHDIFPASENLTVTTTTSGDGQMPSTSSPPAVSSTVTYHISPRVRETVQTTNRWKEDEADISLDEIFGETTSTTTRSRRFSAYYQDPTGFDFDTIRSEDSGVTSGGRTTAADVVIDEAFKGVFDELPSKAHHDQRPRIASTSYDDYYITSLAEAEDTDSEVDVNNLDVTHFVDDILGKSLDEAAFLSSTKSLINHTDTSIDRKRSYNVHPYYRTRTDTSIDNKKNKRVVISEQVSQIEDNSSSHYYNSEPVFSQDDIMNLIFVESTSKSEQQEAASARASTQEPAQEPNHFEADVPSNLKSSHSSEILERPSDEEFLAIEVQHDYFIIKGSYSLLIPKNDPLGQLLEKIRQRDPHGSLATLDFSLTRKLKKLLMSCLKEKAVMMTEKNERHEGVSHRGHNLVSSIDYASTTFLKMNANKYDPRKNPHGIVNFCTAENNLCTPLLEERFKHLELFFPNTEHLVRYPPSGGWPETREVLCKYFKEFMKADVAPSELVLTASVRTGYDVTSYCLFEEDDILLTNGPIYTGTISNVNERAQCQVEVVETDLSHPRLEVAKYEAELQKHHDADNSVAGVIIVNPQNPMGVVFPPEDVIALCNWATSNNLHVIIDEVFANCVFDKTAKFKSFLSYRHRISRPENIAYLWSVSKDFGLPGLKFAVIHSTNKSLQLAATKLQLYHPCSPFVQDFAVKLLSDFDWLRSFHSEVNRRMLIHYEYTARNLEKLEIPFIKAQAGIFVFADFSKHLTSSTTPIEYKQAELDLFEKLGAGGVMLTPGVHQKCHVYGWFRIVFACSKEELEEGFRRLYLLLGSVHQPVGAVEY